MIWDYSFKRTNPLSAKLGSPTTMLLLQKLYCHPGGWLAGKQKAQRERYTENPLTHGLIRQDFVNKQGSAVRHPSRTTTGAETALLAAKRNQFLVITGFTPNPEKTVCPQ
jgi:hypothetical protein